VCVLWYQGNLLRSWCMVYGSSKKSRPLLPYYTYHGTVVRRRCTTVQYHCKVFKPRYYPTVGNALYSTTESASHASSDTSLTQPTPRGLFSFAGVHHQSSITSLLTQERHKQRARTEKHHNQRYQPASVFIYIYSVFMY
jgi:hypothetical protein